jgi:hypothetical protein
MAELGLSSSLDGCSGWELNQAYLTELTDFSDLIGDASLQLEVLFVAAVGEALRPLADATLFWHGKKTRDERRVNSESVALIKTMRAASSIFNTYTTALKDNGSFDVLFKASSTRTVTPLVELFDASQVVDKITTDMKAILGLFATAWTTDLKDMSTEVASWCPAWQTMRGALMSKVNTPMVLELCKNVKYPRLAGAANLMQEMVGHIKSIHRDGASTRFINAELLKEVSSIISLAVETTTITYTLFKLRCELPRIKNETALQDERAKLRDFVVSKLAIGIDLGDDVKEALGIKAPGAPE